MAGSRWPRQRLSGTNRPLFQPLTRVEVMEIRLSGAVEAFVDGREIDLGTAKSRAVLAALALSPGTTVPVSRIIELVWGDDPPRTADKTLQSYVTRLRKAGADCIDRSGDGYRLSIEPELVDLVRFERLLDEGRPSEALDIWRGEPLQGVPTDGFAPPISRLTERYLGAVESQIEANIAAGDGAGAIGPLRQLVAENPLREALWGQLMQALYQADRQAEALRAFSEAREHLIDGLGIEPGPALQKLERRILAHDPELAGLAVSSQALAAVEGRSFLFTDIEASTQLWSAHTDEMAKATTEHDRIIKAAVERQGGEVFKHTGDGMLATFPTPSYAVQAAVAAQLDLSNVVVSGRQLAVRMAISTGRADQRDGDWFGPPLNLAARLLDAAHGGQILLGGAAAGGLDNSVSSEVTTVELGLSSLRGLSRPERVHQVLHPALPRRFPPLRALVERGTDDLPDFPPQLEYAKSIPLVGRDEQLSSLTSLWERVRSDNRPAFALLAGEPGVGKTRLSAEFVRRLHEDDGAAVVYGRCAEDHPAPYRPLTEALGTYSDARSDAELRTEMGAQAEMLTVVLPGLATRFADLEPVALGAEGSHLPIFDAVTSFLQVASSSPLVVVLDDIHWADRASLDLLLHLVRHVTSGRLLFVATYRDVEVDRAHPLSRVLADLRREERVERIAVRGVDEAGAIALTEAVLGHELSDAGRGLAAQAGLDAAGNPFFLQEMLRHFMESGALVRQQGRWTAADAGTLQQAVPEGVREVVGRRLDHISDAANQLLRTASAFPDEIDSELLMALSDAGEDEVLDLLDETLEAGLLVDSRKPDHYEFSHALIRQTLYREFSTARRLRLHRRIAESLISTSRHDDATVNAIAHHYLAAAHAADPAEVARWAREAATLAADRFAFEEALALIEDAVDVTEGLLSPDDEIRLRGACAAARIRLYRLDDTDMMLPAMVELASEASAEAVARAAVEVSRSVFSGSYLGADGSTLAQLLQIPKLSALTPSLRAALLVEQRHGNRAASFSDGLLDSFDDMDSPTLDRALVTFGSTIPTREEIVRWRVAASRAAKRDGTSAVLRSADLAEAMASRMLWERSAGISEQPATRWRTRSEGMLQILPLVEAVRQGRVEESAAIMSRLEHVIDAVYPRWRTAWTRYEMDLPVQGSEGGEGFFRPGSITAMVPHARTEKPTEMAIRAGLSAHPSMISFLIAAELAWEAGLAELGAEIFDLLKRGSGLGSPVMGGQYVVGVDYHLGLLLELQGRTDQAIDMHLAAIEQCRPIAYVLDEAYAAWHLVRLLGARDRDGDVELARRVATEALEALEPTPYERRKRELREMVAELPG